MGELVLAATLLLLATTGAASVRRHAPRPRLAPRRPVQCGAPHSRSEHRRAARFVRRHAVDSLDPFALRDDKRYFFGDRGMLAYRVVGRTALVGGDPLGPADAVPGVVARFLSHAAARGWNVVMTGASARHLAAYRRLKLRALHIGNEAVVDPRTFSLEGRTIRKVRQSVARIARRGWSVAVVPARAVDAATRAELATVERRWHAEGRRMEGFAMTMGRLGEAAEHELEGCYVVARDPSGRVRAFQRYAAYRGGISLDLSRRLGDEPNGLSEAMVVAVLEHARASRLVEVSLNFAGFGHLMCPPAKLTLRRRLARAALRCVHGRFQLERLVRFNDKFHPVWRPRYLVYRRRLMLPLAALRVLQAEGYLRPPRAAELTTEPPPPARVRRPRASPVAESMTAAGPRVSR